MKTNSVKPEVFVCTNKDRQKIYGTNTVYLQNKQTFEFELFNPTSDNIMAKISINGKLISNRGLILRPGTRGFLERHIDEDRKFLFETYEVDGESKEVQRAIASNGDIKIEFFREKQCPPTITYNCYTTYTNPYHSRDFGTFYDDFKTTCTDGNLASSDSVSCSSSEGEKSINFNSVDHSPDFLSRSFAPKAKKSIETGRVEKGSASGQRFNEVNMDFECTPFCTIFYKLMPASQKPVVLGDLKVKCQICGTKFKKNWKFCSTCGSPSPVSEGWKCMGCGSKVDESWNYCPNCNRKLK